MKIGILTHHYVNNYGAFLQAYCLCAAIRELYPESDVRVIDYVNRKHLFINTAGCFRFFRGRETLGSWLQKTRLPGLFRRARREELPLTRPVRTAAEINALGLDVIVVGSDEVWNYRDPKSADPVKFGCGLTARLVAYAPSVGRADTFDDLPEEMRAGIARFSAVCARDDNTAKLLTELTGKPPARVPDPTFLFAPPVRRSARVKALTAKPYALLYHCAPLPRETRAALRALAAERGLRLLGAGEYDRLYDEPTVDLSPFEWSAMFGGARLVITGTFHGAVFALLNGKPLAVCPNNPTRAAKLAALLAGFGLSDRLLSPESVTANDLLKEGLDAGRIEMLKAEEKQRGLAYLREAIGSADR